MEDYFAFVTRAWRSPDLVEVWVWTLRQPLPRIPIPLRQRDADVQLDLAQPYRTAFTRGGYPRPMRYDRPPSTLEPDALQWAQAQVAV